MNRRKFIKLAGRSALVALLGGSVYAAAEARWLDVTRLSIRLPNLPPVFTGATIAFVADIHHSLVMPEPYIHDVVSTVNALRPDFIILGGDYITAGERYNGMGVGVKYLDPCFGMLSALRAPEGIFAVTGNHDTRGDLDRTDACISRAGFANLSNTGVWVTRGASRVRFCGVGDLRTQRQRLRPALADATDTDAVILVTHNPDYAELLHDARVGLVLSGHTHGGQVVIPLMGSVRVPSEYGQKYRYGLVQAPATQVYVTSGVGTLPLAVRFLCRPEVAIITLTE